MKTALLLSGGLDSISIASWYRPDCAITLDYGQLPFEGEVRAARQVAGELGIEHFVIRADLSDLGSGDMAGQPALSIASEGVTEWWPYRNQMLVTLAAMKSVTLGVNRLLIGCLKTDNLHADGSPVFVDALDHLLSLQEGKLRLEAPALGLTAVELIKKSGVPMDLLAWAHSCHKSDFACGMCRGCQKHYETMSELGCSSY